LVIDPQALRATATADQAIFFETCIFLLWLTVNVGAVMLAERLKAVNGVKKKHPMEGA
jgi:hypothetical protein